MLIKFIHSYQKNKRGILLMLISSICVCFGQLFWKLYASQTGQVLQFLSITTLFLGLGFLLYGIGAVIMVISYKYGSLSVLQPILSLNYVLTILLAVTILKESVSLLKGAGILCVLVGVIFISGGDD
jgi:undecaprenyl phosphate-alpha-L-ara4N flippase subunit ArnE